MFTNSKSIKTYRSKPLKIQHHGGGVADRQAKIPGFDQDILSRITVFCAGAGGIMSVTASSMTRKGVGHIVLCDEDTVEPSNLNRQKFYRQDIGKNKALRLAKNLSRESFLGSKVSGIPLKVMDALRAGLVPDFDCIICGIDDEPAREELAEYALTEQKPLITIAVSGDGDGGYVQIQKPGEACWGCAFPRPRMLREDLDNYRAPCPGTPAIMDILLTVGGAAVYALDCLFMRRPITWNYREFHLAGHMPDLVRWIERRPSCHMCGSFCMKNIEFA